jgi:hypothetical protein
MDDDIRALCAQLESRFMDGENKGKTCDIADWISFFAWDFLGHMTWSKRIGFMEKGADIGDMLGTAERVMRYFSVVCLSSSLTLHQELLVYLEFSWCGHDCTCAIRQLKQRIVTWRTCFLRKY